MYNQHIKYMCAHHIEHETILSFQRITNCNDGFVLLCEIVSYSFDLCEVKVLKVLESLILTLFTWKASLAL